MDVVQWGTLAALATFLFVFGGILFRGADRLNKVEARANEASKSADDLRLQVERMDSELNEHRIAVAKEYVSRETLEAMESKLIDAINRLGDRLDRAFQTSTGISGK